MQAIMKANLKGDQQIVLYTSSSDTPLKSVSVLNGHVYFIKSLSDEKALRSMTINGEYYKTL